MVRHEWHQVILKNHFAIVKIEASNLNIKGKIEDLNLRGFISKNILTISITITLVEFLKRRLTCSKHVCVSRGKSSKLIAQIKVILVAKTYKMSLC